jgi:hypothetical protein
MVEKNNNLVKIGAPSLPGFLYFVHAVGHRRLKK